MSENAYDYESSSSSEDEKMGFWGGSGGSSSSLSKYMAKREKESKKELQKELAAKRELEIAKEKAEAARAEAARAELAKAEIVRQEIVAAESVKDIQKSMGSQTLAQMIGGETSKSYSQLPIRSSATELQNERISSAKQSKEQIYEAPKYSVDHAAALMAAYVAQAMNQAPAFANKGVPREVFDAEPELLDSIPASKVLRRIGAYRNWTEEEIQADLNALEFHRLRLVKDLRELSIDSWKEIKELLPLVRELLVKEINRGRQVPVTRPDVPLPSGSSFSMSDTPVEYKNIRAPTSTPMDSPDMSQFRRTFQGRQW
jgi:hypothetical protein